ncbi:MAG: di-trans,poly-cis-decaprenylcistransferase, partial [Halanaerobiales bacterium]|nr:di-trans,poly-cis-decaprenylcistransferase [Halanaerobiales bacterium]
FAFSTENWERPVTEVNFLMNLFKKVFTEEIGELENENVRVQILGSRNNLDKGLLQVIDRLEKRTQNNDGLFLNVCLNYGGRAEIIEAVNKILSEDQIPEKIDEESLKEFLYTKDLPDVELMIRTSGEMRISNFFLYQSAYAELVFTPVLWPNFTKEDLKNALIEFQNRDRRFGRVEKR